MPSGNKILCDVHKQGSFKLEFLSILVVGYIMVFSWCFCPLGLVKLYMVTDAISVLVKSGKGLREEVSEQIWKSQKSCLITLM